MLAFHVLMNFKSCMIPLNYKLETVNLFTTIVDNAGEAWETSSVFKENDGVSAPPSYMFFLWFYLPFSKLRLVKKLDKQGILV